MNQLDKATLDQARMWIEEYGNPVTTQITLFQKLFYPKSFFNIREGIIYDMGKGLIKQERNGE